MSPSTKMLCAGLAASLGCILFQGCNWDPLSALLDPPQTKQDKFPGRWVACQGNQPTMMQYEGDVPISLNYLFLTPPSFQPADWDCTHPNSPHYKNSNTSARPFSSGLNGPLSVKEPRAAASGPMTTYLPRRLLWLPFVPPVPTPATPAGCDPSYPDVLQTNHTHALLTRISTCPFQIMAKIPVVSRPLQVEITPDGTTALVTSFDNAVNFIDLATNTVTFTLNTSATINPNGIAISPDGSTFYITSFNPFNPVVLVIDMATRKTIATLPTIPFPQGATLTPDGSQLWVTSPLSMTMQVFDTLTNTSVTQLAIAATTDVAFNSTGTRAYITSGASSPGSVVVVDTATYQRIKSYTVGNGPADIAMAYGEEFLVVNNWSGNSVSVIDLIKDKVSTTAVGANPGGIAFVK
jgi:YVTN family beta-propeller protein